MAGSPDGPLEALANLVQGYVGWTERLSRWLEGNGPAIRRFLEGVSAFYEGFPIALMAASATFARGGWSEVPLANMNLSETTDLLERLRDKPDDEVRRELYGVIPAYFRRDGYAELEEMVDGWHEHFGRRHETFEQALFAHKEGLYRLSIPALAAQVEGVLRDLTKEHGTFGGKWIKRFNEAFGFDHGPSDLPPPPDPERLAAEFLAMPARERYEALEELRARFALVRINELFASGTYGDPEFASSVRRHSILHGAFEAYGELQSLRLFFLLEVLHDAVGRYKSGSGSWTRSPLTPLSWRNGRRTIPTSRNRSRASCRHRLRGPGNLWRQRRRHCGSPTMGGRPPASRRWRRTRRGDRAGSTSSSRSPSAVAGWARRSCAWPSTRPVLWACRG